MSDPDREGEAGARILVVEDDRRTAETIALYLRHARHRVSVEHDGTAGLRRAQHETFDLLVLDRMLPGTEGIDIVRAVRGESNVPVIFVSARGLEEDRLTGFAAGADDYVTKPFSSRELVARVDALLRRSPRATRSELRVGPLTINHDTQQISIGTRAVDLTPSERSILVALAEHPARVFTRSVLIERLPGESSGTMARTIDAHVRNLRRKLAQAECAEFVSVETVFGVGYRLLLRPT